MTTANRTMTRNIISIHLGESRALADELVRGISDEDCVKISSMRVGDVATAIREVIKGKGAADESDNTGDADSRSKDEAASSGDSVSVAGLDPQFIDAAVDEEAPEDDSD